MEAPGSSRRYTSAAPSLRVRSRAMPVRPLAGSMIATAEADTANGTQPSRVVEPVWLMK